MPPVTRVATYSESDHETLLNDCQARESRLNEWERDFISSIDEKLAQGRTLTQAQDDTLNKIWDKATADG